MSKRIWFIACVFAALFALPGKAPAQTATPESLAAAKELIIETKIADQIRMTMPLVLQRLRPGIAKGNSQIERDFDALMPFVLSAVDEQLDGFLSAAAQIYARQLTVDEMREVLSFYRTPTGQKLLQKLPGLMQEIMVLGQQFGQSVAADAQARMTEGLRKRGHNI